jgi:hypothetical protein
LSDKLSNIGTVAMFVTAGLQAIFYAQFVAAFIIYLCTKFRMSGSNGSLVSAIKPTAEKKIHYASMLLVHILQK